MSVWEGNVCIGKTLLISFFFACREQKKVVLLLWSSSKGGMKILLACESKWMSDSLPEKYIYAR